MMPFCAQTIEQRHKLKDAAEHSWHAGSPSGSEGGQGGRHKRRRHAGWDIASMAAYSLLLVSGLLLVAVSKGLTSTTSAHGQALGWWCALLGVGGWVTAGLPLPLSSSALTLVTNTLNLGGQYEGPSKARPLARVAAGLALPMRTAMLVGLGLAALGTVGLLDQAASDIGTHCVMAEAAVRIAHLEEAVTKVKHDELLTQVFFRLNEMDDLIAATAQGTSAHAELRTQTFSMLHQDKDLIRERVGRLHRHAQHLLQDMRNQMAAAKQSVDNATRHASTLSATAARAGAALHIPAAQEAHEKATRSLQEVEEQRRRTEEELWLVSKRVEAVESVLQYIDARSHDAHAELTFEEYQIVLNALIDGTQPAPSPSPPHGSPPSSPEEAMQAKTPALALREALTKDQADIASLQTAFERRGKGGKGYEAIAANDPRLRAVKEAASRREAARKDFEQRFFSVYEEGIGHTQPAIFTTSLSKALDSLPQHCLSDMAAFSRLRWLALGLAAALALAAHTTITALTSKVLAAKSL
ncbi:hypothetical protein V8C86DRAFT_2476205 [Haematococcus lacustris]